MQNSRRSAMLAISLGVALFSACNRSSDSRTAEPNTQPQAEPVLRSDDDPKAILTKAVKAHGGEKAFARWKCGRIKYKAEGNIIPGALGNTTMEDTFQLPGHFKRVSRVTVDGKELVMVFVLNHGKGWTKAGGGEPEPEENAFTERTEHPLSASINLLPSLNDKLRLTRLPGGTADTRGRIGIRAEGEDVAPVNLYFDAQTGLLQSARDAREPPAAETVLEDYKEIQGGMVPMQIKIVRAGQLIGHATFLEVEFRDKFEEREFAKP
jgi:hypothetical protein